jgi:AcrR family transcriptional regulator
MSPRPKLDRVRKAQIRAAAAELIAERGLAATRVEDVATRAGTSKPAVLYWFTDKDELLSEALTLQDEVFYGQLSARMESLDGAGAQLRLLLDAFLTSYEYRLWMELWVRALRDPGTEATRQALDRRWRRMMAETIRLGQAAGEFGPGDPDDLALGLAALLDGLCVQLTLQDPDVSRTRVADIWIRAADSWLATSLRAVPADGGAGAEWHPLTPLDG